MRPEDIQNLTIGICMTQGAASGLADVQEMVTKLNTGRVPDQPGFKKALQMWGVTVLGAGDPISLMCSTEPTLVINLPDGWVVKNVGNGHNNLLDNRGCTRLWWHIHAWDPIASRIDSRYSVGEKSSSPTLSEYRVLDGNTPIHSVPFVYPFARNNVCPGRGDHVSYYLLKEDFPGQEARQSAYAANDDVHYDARKQAEAWLDEHRPGWKDAAKSWGIDGSPVDN